MNDDEPLNGSRTTSESRQMKNSMITKATCQTFIKAARMGFMVLTSTLLAPHTFGAVSADRPSVILIYTDDHGYTDLGVLGIDKHVDTPNMDKLAHGGALMTAGYSSAPQCQPSRAGLMAGRIQNEFGFGQNQADARARAACRAPTPKARTWQASPY